MSILDRLLLKLTGKTLTEESVPEPPRRLMIVSPVHRTAWLYEGASLWWTTLPYEGRVYIATDVQRLRGLDPRTTDFVYVYSPETSFRDSELRNIMLYYKSIGAKVEYVDLDELYGVTRDER
jgi:hypothetical protein